MKTYHKDVGDGIPPNMNIKVGTISPRYTQHALEEAQLDMGLMKLPQQISYKFEDIVEAYVKGSKLEKYVVRLHYDTERDICFVIKPENNLVLTNWFNKKSDKHTTLSREKYQLHWTVKTSM